MNVKDELIDSILYLIDKSDKSTKIYNGLITQANSDGTYEVQVNGKVFVLSKYSSNTVAVNSLVKVFVPQNNMSMAFFM